MLEIIIVVILFVIIFYIILVCKSKKLSTKKTNKENISEGVVAEINKKEEKIYSFEKIQKMMDEKYVPLLKVKYSYSEAVNCFILAYNEVEKYCKEQNETVYSLEDFDYLLKIKLNKYLKDD